MCAELLNRGRPGLVALAAGALSLPLACSPPTPAAGLPDTLSVILRTTDGELLSVLVGLPRPGVDPVVRLSPGALAVEQGRAEIWMSSPAPPGDERVEVDLYDLRSKERAAFTLEGTAQLHSFAPGRAIARQGQTWVELTLEASPRIIDQPSPAFVDDVAEHPGPGGGLGARLVDGRFELRLPREDEQWAPLLVDIEHLVGLSWIDSSALPPWQLRVLDDRFKQISLIRLSSGLAVLDGSLKEWQDEQAIAIRHPSQILMGQSSWSGEVDGGMGVAARRDEQGDLLMAFRVRDDHWEAQRDALLVRWGEQEIRVSLEPTGSQAASGWEAEVRQTRPYERTVELRVLAEGRLDSLRAGKTIPALMVELVDGDPGQPVTLLSSAPWPAALTLGSLLLEPDGPARPAPQ